MFLPFFTIFYIIINRHTRNRPANNPRWDRIKPFRTSSGSVEQIWIPGVFSVGRHDSVFDFFCQIAISPFSDIFSQQRSLAMDSILFCSSSRSSKVRCHDL
ncbi:hypothetical protein LXL04_011472 [Taraxacum kok-saghyz]